MLRIRCTVDDLLRVSIAEHPAPLGELTLAIQMLQRRDPHPAFAPWRHRMARTFAVEGSPLAQLVSPLGAGPMFLDPPSPTMDEGVDRVMSASRLDVRAELERVCAIDRPRTPWVRGLADRDKEAWKVLEGALRTAYRATLAEAWPRLRASFHAETAWRARILARDGLRATLTGLSPSIRWRDMTLEIDFPREVDITLTGQGISLQPSLLWAGPPLIARYGDGPLILIYPALTPLPLLTSGAAADPLSGLLGATRARALRVLTFDRTTSELAKELSVTVAAASLQTKTLRAAGLVVSQREGKAVRHRCTHLGLDLLASG
ncbi:hypothetical protein [Amycolatopsis sp. NPDC058986]|uniref:ArsR/SmtB family transcription factor n=1 Tax=unclassified Amycolatopsis TaxID=2618356 RepID=UPI00366D10ED